MTRAVIAGTLVFVVPPGALLELCRSRSALSQTRCYPTPSRGALTLPQNRVDSVRETLSDFQNIRKHVKTSFPHILVGYLRVSRDTNRQITNLQRDAWLDAGVDPRQLYADKVRPCSVCLGHLPSTNVL